MLLENDVRVLLYLTHKSCPSCKGKQYCYRDGRWDEWVCWRCGRYDSNTPAFIENPELFSDIVRKNGRYFMEKYAHQAKTRPDEV
jgi:hypothetical protein